MNADGRIHIVNVWIEVEMSEVAIMLCIHIIP